MRYYKATRLDGGGFEDSGTKWEVGKTVAVEKGKKRWPFGKGQVELRKLLSAFDAPGEVLVDGSWPCRLFLVEGTPIRTDKHACYFYELFVAEELPAWQALGPNGEAVVDHLKRSKTITEEQAKNLSIAWEPTGGLGTDDPVEEALRLSVVDSTDVVGDAAKYAMKALERISIDHAEWSASKETAHEIATEVAERLALSAALATAKSIPGLAVRIDAKRAAIQIARDNTRRVLVNMGTPRAMEIVAAIDSAMAMYPQFSTPLNFTHLFAGIGAASDAMDSAMADGAELGSAYGATDGRMDGAEWFEASEAAEDAVTALVVKGLIPEEHFEVLYRPWREVMEKKGSYH